MTSSNYAQRSIDMIKAGIATMVTDPNAITHADDLAQRVNDLAEAEGVLYVATLVEQIGDRPKMLQRRLIEILSEGASDTYSGRRGDVARSRFDGIRREARNHIDWSE